MHAVLITVGTDGDVIPYIGLGAALTARGHRVTLAANEHFRDAAHQQGFEFHSLVSDDEYRRWIGHPDMWHPTRSALLGIRWGKRLLKQHYEQIAQLAAGPDCVLVANPGILPARIVSEKLARPLVSIVLQPWLIHSVLSPPTMPGKYHLPRWMPRPAVRLHYRLMNLLGDVLLGGDVNRLRSEVGLPRVRGIFRWWWSPTCMIGLFPAWYGLPQADWPRQLRLAGFPQFDGRTDAELDDELRAFCQAGEPPIAFTLGTGMMHAATFFRTAIEACRLLQRRGILLTQFPQQLPHPLPPEVRHAAYAPFTQLFPLCAAIVHHGGIGTAAKALAAGIPQLVLPLAFDQMDNARRLQDLGVAVSLKPHRRTAADLAAALEQLMNVKVQACCQEIRGNFSADNDALAVAAVWIEEIGLAATAPLEARTAKRCLFPTG